MFIDPMRDGAALRQESHVGFYMHTLLDLHGPPDGGRETPRSESINMALPTEGTIQDSRDLREPPKKHH